MEVGPLFGPRAFPLPKFLRHMSYVSWSRQLVCEVGLVVTSLFYVIAFHVMT
jgi:hypothetical protein